MKIGTRLTIVLLLALSPIIAAFTYWNAHRSTQMHINDLKRDIRATTRSLTPTMENDLLHEEVSEVKEVIRRMSVDQMLVAVLKPDGNIWYQPESLPFSLAGIHLESVLPAGDGFSEFERHDPGGDWFYRIVPLADRTNTTFAYLLVAQDWSDVREDLRTRVIGSVVASVLLVAVMIAIIPLTIRRYVTVPLGELSRKVTQFSAEDGRSRELQGDEVGLLTQEFKKLDAQLTEARQSLLHNHRKELELQRTLQHAQRLATIGTLASGLAHEIGTPMGVIRSRAEHLLQNEPTTARTRSSLETIVSQIDRVTRIVRMLLDYARSRDSHKAVCDVRQILHTALSLMDTEAARREVKVIAEPGATPLMVTCDSGQLQQVFVNLIMNALDAMTPGGGVLHITASTEQSNGTPQVTLAFKDTGPGVAPQDAESVFDPFFTTKEPGSGTGMGLAVSQSIMQDHDGAIRLESGPEGAKFFVTMQLNQGLGLEGNPGTMPVNGSPS